ncbi:MAG: DUF4199 domain-containing protein [Gemmatimonadales bacterium]
MRKIVLTFGLIAGGILSAMMLISLPFQDRIGFENAALLGYTTMVLAFLLVFFGVKSYRDNVAGGRISFGRAFSVGLLITLVATICYVATWQVVYYKLAPDFVEKYTAYTLDKERAAGASEGSSRLGSGSWPSFGRATGTRWSTSLTLSSSRCRWALVLTLVSAGVLGRKRRPGWIGRCGGGDRLRAPTGPEFESPLGGRPVGRGPGSDASGSVHGSVCE